jgi:AraC-like DNA-binding protein
MADEPQPCSERAQARTAATARRKLAATRRQRSLEALAAGWTLEQIAELRQVSVRTLRREIDRALDQRRLDAPDRYIHLQVLRLTKALRLADLAIERGDQKAHGPMVKVVAALDRYHGLKGKPERRARAPAAPPLPAPPLALTFAAPPLAPVLADGEKLGEPAGVCSFDDRRAAP